MDTELGLIILMVRDPSRALAFYRRCFDWPVAADGPTYKELRMPSGQRLGLYPQQGGGGATQLYFYAEDPSALMARLSEAGARLVSPMSRRAWNEDAAYYADPDGHILVVASRPRAPEPPAKEGLHLALSRCTVRDWRRSDGETLVRYANDASVARNLRDRFPHPYTERDAAQFLAFCERMSPRTYFAIAVDDQAVGGIGLTLHDDIERVSAELGYWLGAPFRGRGIVTEAVVALTEWGFATLPLTRVYALPFAHNAASARVLEKAGYALEGRLRKNAIKDGEVIDQLMYAQIR